MAIYHLSVKLITRGAGRSSTAASAYRAADRVHDERTGLVFDYGRKRGVEHTEIVLPSTVAESATWARDRQRLWNAAESAEKRKDARVAREYEVALPHELNRAQRLELVRAFAVEITERYGAAVDFAIHAPHRQGDARNHHAHILTTTRRVTERGLDAKTDIELKDTDRKKRGLSSGRVEVTAIRERWAALVNVHLAEHGHTARVDHRSLVDQGIDDREPTQHKGPAVTAIERRGERTRVDERLVAEATERLQRAAELGRLEREASALACAIVDTTTALTDAIAAREADRTRSVEQIRRDAQATWLAARTSPSEPAAAAPMKERAIDLSGDLAAVRREAREQWLAQRSTERTTEVTPRPVEPSPEQSAMRKLILPDDDLAK